MSLSHLPDETHQPHRNGVATSIVSPQFQKPISMAATLSELRSKDPQAVPETLIMQAAAPGPARTGINFIPPLNCNPTIISPTLSPALSATFAAATPALPDYFNWGDVANVAQSKNWGVRDVKKLGQYVQDPPDQMGCGSCWAVSSASALSDRYAIKAQAKNPVLSPTLVLGCVGNDSVPNPIVHATGSNRCNGGFPADAAELFNQYGTVSFDCSNYDWCATSSDCKGGQGDLNPLVPVCDIEQVGCVHCDNANVSTFGYGGSNCKNIGGDHKLYKVARNENGTSSLSLQTPHEIKADVFLNGPVVAAMAVYQDFYAFQVTDFWAKTKHVYINLQTDDAPYNSGGMNRSLAGYHAVVIVGWGIEKNVPSWKGDGKTYDVPYWIIRNSWGAAWNAGNTVGDHGFKMPGYWKHAMIQTHDGMVFNEKIGIDNPIPVGMQMIGGATSFVPDVPVAAPPAKSGKNWACKDGKCSKSKSGTFATRDACKAACQKSKKKVVVKPDKNKGQNTDDKEVHWTCNTLSGACHKESGPGEFKTETACESQCKVNDGRLVGLIVGLLLLIVLIIIVVWLVTRRNSHVMSVEMPSTLSVSPISSDLASLG